MIFLHFLRRAIGTHSLYIVMGAFMLLSLLGGAPNVAADLLQADTAYYPSFRAFAIPVFMMLLVIYETHGTLETQRIILSLVLIHLLAGLSVSLILTMYSQNLIGLLQPQFDLYSFLTNLRYSLFAFTVLNLVFLFLLPILQQNMRNRRVPFFACIAIEMALLLLCHESILALLCHRSIWNEIMAFWPRDLLIDAILSILSFLYIRTLNEPQSLEPKTSFGIITDVFKHFQSTDALRRSMEEWEEKYQAVLNHSSELIFLINEQNYVINVNQAAMRILLPLISRKLQLCDFLFNEDDTPFQLPKLDTSEQLGMFHDKPLLFRNLQIKSPSLDAPISVDCYLSYATVDSAPVAILIARDMTEQHRQEHEKHELQEQLTHSQRLESIGQLAGGVAHDFNNLLHSIQCSTETIRMENLSFSAQNMLTNIEEATKRAATLTSQLLGFARKGNFHSELLELSSLVQQAASLFKPSAANISFKTIIEPEIICLNGDSVQLQQVILNLLINAKDAVLAVENRQDSRPRIVLRAERLRQDTPEWTHRPDKNADGIPEDFLCIKVKDNGIGMSEETIKHIYEPFFTTKEVGKGTGMGLAMAYGCITNHHGWIHVTSIPDNGTEFTLVLPIAS